MSYAWSKLRLAVQCLAQPGSQRDRLMAALALHLAYLKPKDLPATCRPDLYAITDRICLQKTPTLSKPIKERLNAIEDRDINAMIDAILRMYDAVTRYQPLPDP